MAESNRRQFPRHKVEDTLEVLLIPDDFEGPKDSCDLITAKMVNQSNNGLYIEIDRDLQTPVDAGSRSYPEWISS